MLRNADWRHARAAQGTHTHEPFCARCDCDSVNVRGTRLCPRTESATSGAVARRSGEMAVSLAAPAAQEYMTAHFQSRAGQAAVMSCYSPGAPDGVIELFSV